MCRLRLATYIRLGYKFQHLCVTTAPAIAGDR